jgi:hypothetical protein
LGKKPFNCIFLLKKQEKKDGKIMMQRQNHDAKSQRNTPSKSSHVSQPPYKINAAVKSTPTLDKSRQ